VRSHVVSGGGVRRRKIEETTPPPSQGARNLPARGINSIDRALPTVKIPSSCASIEGTRQFVSTTLLNLSVLMSPRRQSMSSSGKPRSIKSQLKSRHHKEVFGRSSSSRRPRVSYKSLPSRNSVGSLPKTTLEFEEVKTPRRPAAAAVVEASKEKRTQDASSRTPNVQEDAARHNEGEKAPLPTQSPSLLLDSSDDDEEEAELLRHRPIFATSRPSSKPSPPLAPADTPLRDGEPRAEKVTPAPEEWESSPTETPTDPVLTTPQDVSVKPKRIVTGVAQRMDPPDAVDDNATATKDTEAWSCTTCTLNNPIKARRCIACKARRPVEETDTISLVSSKAESTDQAKDSQRTLSPVSTSSPTEKSTTRKRQRSSSRKATPKGSFLASPQKNRAAPKSESRSQADPSLARTAVATTIATTETPVTEASTTAPVERNVPKDSHVDRRTKEQVAMVDLRTENDSLRDALHKERQEILRLREEVEMLRANQAAEIHEPEEKRLPNPDTLMQLEVVFREYKEQQALSFQHLLNGSTNLIRSSMAKASTRTASQRKSPAALASPSIAQVGRYQNPTAAGSPPKADQRADAFSQESSQAFALSQYDPRTPPAQQLCPPPSPANSTQTFDPAIFAKSSEKSKNGIPTVLQSQEKPKAKTPNSTVDQVGKEQSSPIAQRSPANSKQPNLSNATFLSGMKAPPPRAANQQANAKTTGSEDVSPEDHNVEQVARKKPPLLNSTNNKPSAPWMSNVPNKTFMDDLEKASATRRKPAEAQGWVSSKVLRPAQKAQSTDIWDDSQDANPSYKYQEVVRCKAKRQGLPCHDCPDCQAFYACLRRSGHEFSQDFGEMEHSRHRARFTPPETPADFWEIDFIDEKRASIEKAGNAST
jgi:hypothetical protein